LSCEQEVKDASLEKTTLELELMALDRKFSDQSAEQGFKNAFIDQLDSNAVLLRPNMMPIEGGAAVDYLIQQDDHDFTLSWDPRHAVVSSSGDLGFTYGVYILKPISMDTMVYGNYVHIWKRQPDSTWRLALQTANEGLGDQTTEVN
jgi:ketosteroid isomerase-like protein